MEQIRIRSLIYVDYGPSTRGNLCRLKESLDSSTLNFFLLRFSFTAFSFPLRSRFIAASHFTFTNSIPYRTRTYGTVPNFQKRFQLQKLSLIRATFWKLFTPNCKFYFFVMAAWKMPIRILGLEFFENLFIFKSRDWHAANIICDYVYYGLYIY